LEPTRIFLGDIPPMLRELVIGLLSSTPDFELAGELGSETGFTPVPACAACVVITRLDRARIHQVLRAHPGARVLALTDDGSSGSLCQLEPVERQLGEISPQSLRAAIRGLIRPTPE
jgi:hypothetical protein